MARNIKIGLIGNPNCGKTTLFNALTGSKQHVGNWAGVTVEKKIGYFEYRGTEVELIDLPGVYSLDVEGSLDEKIALNFLMQEKYDLIINVIDSSNLGRNLYLTLQLLEIGVPVLLTLNMLDLAERKSIKIDSRILDESLDVLGVSEVVARSKQGIETLKANIIKHASGETELINKPVYYSQIETAINALASGLDGSLPYNKSWMALKLLEGAEFTELQYNEAIKAQVKEYQAVLEQELEDEPEILIASARYDFIDTTVKQVQQVRKSDKKTPTDILDSILINKYLGLPIFLAIMYSVFTLSIVVGGALQNFFELGSEAIFIDGVSAILQFIYAPEWLIVLLADGVGGGIQTVAAFIPVIGFMYVGLSFLENSGYMARAAFIMDRFMRTIGLPGKAFVPLIIGFGCNVPSIMATRTLDNEEDRITTIMMAPFMSCGARLSVYALFCAAFFPRSGQNIVFLLYVIGVLVALATGFLIRKLTSARKGSYLVLELPDYHAPSLKELWIRTYDRLQGFVWRAGKLIVVVFVALHLAGSVNIYGRFDSRRDNSILAGVSRAITPIFKPMGINDGNWPATVGIFTGVFAKEVVVGTLSALYDPVDEDVQEEKGVLGTLLEAAETIPENFAGIYNDLTNPLWLNISDPDLQETFIEQDNSSIAARIRDNFDGKIGAFAYLLFILLYFPCVSAFAAIYRELNLKWAIISAVWSTYLAYLVAVLFYQIAKYITVGHISLAAVAITVSIGIIMLLNGKKIIAS